jgi:hypothetical protein
MRFAHSFHLSVFFWPLYFWACAHKGDFTANAARNFAGRGSPVRRAIRAIPRRSSGCGQWVRFSLPGSFCGGEPLSFHGVGGANGFVWYFLLLTAN